MTQPIPSDFEGDPEFGSEPKLGFVQPHPHLPMRAIPEEIWLIIFKFVQDGASQTYTGGPFDSRWYDSARTASVRSLTETCRTFHRICRPLLLETILIDAHSGLRRTMIDVLQSKPHLRSMVSRVRIIGRWIPDPGNRLEKPLMELYSLREVWIKLARTSGALWNHLQLCPLLETLILGHATVTNTTQPTTFSLHSLKHLQYQQYFVLEATDFCTALILPQLETLYIDSGFLSGAANACSHKIFQFRPSVLKKLTIRTASWSRSIEVGLLELLTRANRIRALTLDGLPPFSHSFSLPDDLIPELEIFHGKASIVLTFCKGRPVRELCTWFHPGATWDMTDSIPNLIRPGLISLERLDLDQIHWDGDTMGYIARHCPQLVSLKIRARSHDIDGKLSHRYHMPKLRKATFLTIWDNDQDSWFTDGRDGELKAEMEVKVMQECREFWTQLEYLRLDPNYFWRFRGPEVEQFQGKEVR
ncbi:hypothetical protein FS837_008920 [Tulasnella sp. UAMH 9824]|nr:hypothetical protein FS837_008920 [Tulasnella sp. UAMH 9824]